MTLFLLEVVSPLAQSAALEAIVAQEWFRGVLLCLLPEDEEVLAVFASQSSLDVEQGYLEIQEAGFSCRQFLSYIYRLEMRAPVHEVFQTFPLHGGQERYQALGNVVYLCLGMHSFSQQQLAWLATCDQISACVADRALLPLAAQEREALLASGWAANAAPGVE